MKELDPQRSRYLHHDESHSSIFSSINTFFEKKHPDKKGKPKNPDLSRDTASKLVAIPLHTKSHKMIKESKPVHMKAHSHTFHKKSYSNLGDGPHKEPPEQTY